MQAAKVANNQQFQGAMSSVPIARRSKHQKVWLGKQGGKYIQAPNLDKRAKRRKAKQHLIIADLQTKCIERIKNPSIFGLQTQEQLKHYLVEAIKILKMIYVHWELFLKQCRKLCSVLDDVSFA